MSAQNADVLSAPAGESASWGVGVNDDPNSPGPGNGNEDLAEGSFGPFNIPVRFTTRGHGPLLVCAYSRYVTDDAAYANTRITVYKAPKKRRN